MPIAMVVLRTAAGARLVLTATGLQLTRLQALARRYGFAYEIYLIHPVQDIVRGTHEETPGATLRDIPGPDQRDGCPIQRRPFQLLFPL